MKTEALRITLLSDTHELHRELDSLPGGDVLIHAGDFSMFSKRWSAIEDFADWLNEQPYTHKILIYGNHEFAFEAAPGRRSVFGDDVHVLHGSGVTVAGLKVWGSPVTPLYGGAFGKSSVADRRKHWAQVPNDTDILVTHGPPYGILDSSGGGEPQGDPELRAAVERVQPLLHVFGHIHGGFGTLRVGETTYINAALLGADGALQHKPVHLRLPKRKGENAEKSNAAQSRRDAGRTTAPR